MQAHNQLDHHIHQLTQIVAKVNRTYVPKEDDDSHTNLYFDAIGERLLGRWIGEEDDRKVFAINIKSFEFEWLNPQRQLVQSFPIAGNTTSQLEEAIALSLPELGMDPAGFREKLHFEIPTYAFAEKPFEVPAMETRELWMAYRNLANRVCHLLQGHLHIVAEPRIWPHHFDTGIYIKPSLNLGLGFGMSMADKRMPSPYFYFAAYGSRGRKINYDSIPELEFGEWWIREDWKGAVWQIPDCRNVKFEHIQRFLIQISEWYLKG